MCVLLFANLWLPLSRRVHENKPRINQGEQVCWQLTGWTQAVWNLTKIVGIGPGQMRVYEDEEVLTMTKEA